MSDTNLPAAVPGALPTIELKELTKVLIRHFDLHKGFYETSVNFMIAVGGVGEPAKPGAMVAVGGVGLSPVTPDHPNAIDASEVNPA